jgi:hypothetical protein
MIATALREAACIGGFLFGDLRAMEAIGGQV